MIRLGLALIRLLHYLPLAVLARIGAALGTLLYVLARARRGVVLTNLRMCFPELGEEERRRLSLELHDETAQVFAAVKMQLGIVRERVEPALGMHLDRALSLVDDGLRGVRNVLNDLRPALLDDLGLLPALRSLVAEFGERHGVSVSFEGPDALPVLSDEAEVALFRAVQEALSNVSRHAEGAKVHVTLETPAGRVRLRIADEGPGFAGEAVLNRAAASGHLGIAGMRERISALGGRVEVRSTAGTGVQIEIDIASGEDSP